MIRPCLAFLVWVSLGGMAAAQIITGPATVIDGDTIVIGASQIRLWGIDAPELPQHCFTANGSLYECGVVAADFLRGLIGSDDVTCVPRPPPLGALTIAACGTASHRLNREMVRQGWAVEFTPLRRGVYNLEEALARRDKAGLWAGTFEMPEEWRLAFHR